jgi:hypothetical protein
MTAIFAYAKGDIAFVAGDTLRADPLHVLPPACVVKVHDWSGTVVFGQAGNAHHQSAMIADIRQNKNYRPDDDTGLANAHQNLRSLHHQAAVAKSGPNLSNGTLLVAAAQTAAFPARLSTLEFSTGNHQLLTGAIAADGTKPADFLAIAQTHMQALSAAGSGTIALDRWAMMCISDAVSVCPNDVGWPADLLIARSDGLGGRIVARRRIMPTAAAGHPCFLA